jgi:hypothetical protein
MADHYDLAEQLLGLAVDDGPATDAVPVAQRDGKSDPGNVTRAEAATWAADAIAWARPSIEQSRPRG